MAVARWGQAEDIRRLAPPAADPISPTVGNGACLGHLIAGVSESFLSMRKEEKKEVADGACKRCGTCCMKGGPSLHLADKVLIDSGRIPATVLITFRKGELARDNVKGALAPLDNEIIKIKGQGGGWTCRFYDSRISGCMAYENRPAECAALKCWDTAEIERIYNRDRLTREALLGGVAGLWDLICEHEARCGWTAINLLAEAGGEKELAQVMEMVSYDRALRDLFMEKGTDASMHDFLLGRPLSETVHTVGLSVIRDGERHRLVKTQDPGKK